MKATVLICMLFLLAQCAVQKVNRPVSGCGPVVPSEIQMEDVKSYLDLLVASGVPGVSVSVFSKGTWWEYSTGFARLEDQTPMQNCHLHYLQSIAKTYTAVAILKLHEEGRISLDESFTTYLPEPFHKYVTYPEKITVRMLLNHTSGLPEYNYDPHYVTQLLQQDRKIFTPEDYLKVVDGKHLQFAPGTKYRYTNLNYELLALIADHIKGDHAVYIRDAILEPLGIEHTYYRSDPGYLQYPELVNGYWDRYSDGILENITPLQTRNVASMIGDDGIVSTPHDAVLFLRGLMEGKLLKPETLDLMMSWVKDGKGEERYGLGLAYARFDGAVAYGHSGGGLGAGCELYYFPEQDVYYFVGINLGTVTASPLHKEVESIVLNFHRAILN